jgi:hypothetical protein
MIRRVLKKIRSNLRRLLVLFLLLVCPQNEICLVAGGVLILLGALSHFYASGYLAKEKILITAGPYRYVRNPFYVSNFVIDSGIILVFLPYLPCVIAGIFYLGLFYGYVIPTRVKKEEEQLGQKFGQEYLEYCSKVPGFLPNPFARPPRLQGRFTSYNLYKNQEISRLITTFLLIPIFYTGLLIKSGTFEWIDCVPIPLILIGYMCSVMVRYLSKIKIKSIVSEDFSQSPE